MIFGIPEMFCGKNGDYVESIINSDMERIYSGLTDSEKKKLPSHSALRLGSLSVL